MAEKKIKSRKIQDLPFGVTGVYLGAEPGKYGTDDYIIDQKVGGKIKILGCAALRMFLGNVPEGYMVHFKYIRTEENVNQETGEIFSKLIIDGRIL